MNKRINLLCQKILTDCAKIVGDCVLFPIVAPRNGRPCKEVRPLVHLRLGMPLNAPHSRTASAVLHRAIGVFLARVLARRELRAYAIRI